MTASALNATLNEELAHIQDYPKGPQTTLRAFYSAIRRNSLGKQPWTDGLTAAGALAQAIADVRKSHPDFVPQFDKAFFGDLPVA